MKSILSIFINLIFVVSSVENDNVRSNEDTQNSQRCDNFKDNKKELSCFDKVLNRFMTHCCYKSKTSEDDNDVYELNNEQAQLSDSKDNENENVPDNESSENTKEPKKSSSDSKDNKNKNVSDNKLSKISEEPEDSITN
ncbi:hypothetical protein HERIO_740 [Hepatospora eriocheir]|uniref:Uncharacterized protein n=1 Tax=Hepatospora eriocheir TaxID=1081669 RepID=A0A1X0QC41_9MICR|nr:hypothetical protein HERIO_740 [Hepatospora eriocheir]